MAWKFVRKSGSYDSGEQGVRLDTEDAEELASFATYHLIRLPQKYRDQPYYVRQVIISKIITAWNKRLKTGRREWQPPHHIMPNHGDFQPDWFDSLPGPDGLADRTQQAMDATAVLALLPRLTLSERTVLELHFGLNGAKPYGAQRIATKLARSRYWVELRLQSGLQELRRLISAA